MSPTRPAESMNVQRAEADRYAVCNGGKKELYLENLLERKLYIREIEQHVSDKTITEVWISDGGKFVGITWNDGHVSRYHAVWLRHNCHCPSCRSNTYTNLVPLDVLNAELMVHDVTMEGEKVVVITWSDGPGEGQHRGPIPTYWLRYYCYSQEAMRLRREQRALIFQKENILPEVEFKDVMKSDVGLYKWLRELSDHGICVVKNVPTEKGTIVKVAERITHVQRTIYGETFDVVSTPDPINPAFSQAALAFHSDQPHYEAPPGIQMLHCIQFDPHIVGGENVIIDMFEMAEQLREERPDYFQILARVPVTFQTMHYSRSQPAHLQMSRPIINLNHRQEVVGMTCAAAKLAPLAVDEEDVEPFFLALAHLYNMMNRSSNTYKFRLTPGDLVTFNNRRMMHSRTSYEGQTGHRFLQGTYVEISEFQSRLQVLHNLLGQGRLARHCGNFSWL
ncbi:gamma-butyrobetaine dioxygenase [Aplysia californica]|uniref:Gamma-butyrobetaine dioxygenase n=1 Tax=Aplysia californica TaxID=6500 RepID=A0ABM1AFQ1_APLCA|nr:gamma-butyrobetaine dioxygenase [Aplysia californica]